VKSTDDNPTPRLSAQKIGRGVVWAYLAFAGGKALVFVSTVILARLLTPADFGLVGLATVVTGYLGTVHTFGVGEAFIQNKYQSEAAANATFLFSVGSGVILFIISVLITPLAISFFNEPRIAAILPTLAFTYVISGFTTINDALLVKQLKFRQRTIPLFVQAIFKGVISIVLALLGFGAWAIVWGVVIGTLAQSITVWIISPWRPTWVWDTKTNRDIFGFGSHLVILNIIGNLEDNFDYLVIGRRLGATQLGSYTLGFRLPELVTSNLASVVSNVAYPAYAQLQTDLGVLRHSVQKATELISWLAIPAGVGLAMISPAFVRTFYSNKWIATIPVMQLLSIYAAVRAITYNFGDAYKAIGRPDILNKVGLATIGLTLLALWFGANYGIEGVAWAHVARAVLLGIINTIVIWRLLSISPKNTLAAAAKPIVCALIMAASMLVTANLMAIAGDAIVLGAQILIGAATYLIASLLLNRSVTYSLWIKAQQVIGRKTVEEGSLA